MKKLNFAILCAGLISGKMANTISQMTDEITPYAIAARDLDRAREMAEKYGFKQAYGSYEELLNDENVDLVYIGSPHSLHAEQVELCLRRNKNVLCEKPMTVNRSQAEKLFQLAREKNLFLMEAVWTRFMPFVGQVQNLIKNGAIGQVVTLTGCFGGVSKPQRMVRPELAGGALLDLGPYPLTADALFLGTDVTGVHADCVKTQEGVDSLSSVILRHESGTLSTLTMTFYAKMQNTAAIYGTEGKIELENFWNPSCIRVTLNDGTAEEIPVPEKLTGYEYEVRACIQAINEGRLECKEMPHAETLRIMGLLDSIREMIGLRFPCE